MVAKRVARAMVLVSLLAMGKGSASWADVITLINGEIFQDLKVEAFEGKTQQFNVHSGGNTVAISAKEVSEIRFDPRPVTLSLMDGKSVYSSLEVQKYDGAQGRFSVHRGAKVVEIQAREVALIDFSTKAVQAANGSIQSATLASDQPGKLPPVLRPIHVVASPAAPNGESEAAMGTESSAVSTPAPVVLEGGSLPPPPPDYPAAETVAIAEGEESSTDGWDDDSLYGPLGDNFGQPKEVVPGQAQTGYVARWKGSGAASGEETKKSSKSEGSSSKKKTSTTSKSKSSGRSSKSKGGSSDREMSEDDQRSSDRGSSRSSRNSRGSSRNSRSSSRNSSDSDYGNYSSSRYGSSSSSRYGGSSSSSSRYGSSYGSNYGSNYGSRYSDY